MGGFFTFQMTLSKDSSGLKTTQASVVFCIGFLPNLHLPGNAASLQLPQSLLSLLFLLRE